MKKFDNLPRDIRSLITQEYLSLKDAVNLSAVSRKTNKLVKEKNHWLNRLKKHFPHVFNSLTGVYADTDYEEVFKQSYKAEYAALSPEVQHLFSLVKDGDIETIKKREFSFKTYTHKDVGGLTPLDWAVYHRNQPILDHIFGLVMNHNKMIASQRSFYDSIFDTDYRGYSLLHWAVLCNKSEFVKQLLSTGFSANFSGDILSKDIHHQPLGLAAKTGQLAMAKEICEKDPSTLDEPDAKEKTALLLASEQGHVEVVDYLLGKNPNLEVATNTPGKDGHGRTALYWAVVNGHTAIVEKLMAKGANAKIALDKMLTQPLHRAAQTGQLAMVKAIIEKDPSTLDELDNFGQTALLWASAKGHVEVVDYLLGKNPNLEVIANAPGSATHGRTSLYWAFEERHTAIVEKLMAKGANAKIALDELLTQPLHRAAETEQLAMVKAIVENDPSTLEEQNLEGDTALLLASKQGHVDIVDYLLENNANLDAASMLSGKTALHWAVEKGHTAIVEKLMAKGANVKMAAGELLNQPLHCAVQTGQLAMVKMNVENDSSTLEEQNTEGDTALLLASKQGHIDIVDYLLGKNPNLEAATSSLLNDVRGKTALYWAVVKGHTAIVEKLIAKGANAKIAVDELLTQPLHRAAQNGQLAMVNAIIENDPSALDEPDIFGQTALLWASVQGHVDIVDYLLGKNPNLEVISNAPGRAEHGRTSLYWAVVNGHTAIVEKLIAKGASAKIALDEMLTQPLHRAVQTGQLAMVKAIVEKDPSTLEEQNSEGDTALLLASKQGHVDVVDYILGKNPNLEAATSSLLNDVSGKTALYWAVVNRHTAIVEKLIANGANAKIALDNMLTQPLHRAVQTGQLAVVKAIVEKDPSTLEEKNSEGDTALLLASKQGHVEVVDYLLGKNPNLEIASTAPHNDGYSKTALYWAVVNGHTAVVEKLMAKGANAKIAVDIMQSQPLHRAMENRQLDMVKAIVENQPSALDEKDASGATAVSLAYKLKREGFMSPLGDAQYIICRDIRGYILKQNTVRIKARFLSTEKLGSNDKKINALDTLADKILSMQLKSISIYSSEWESKCLEFLKQEAEKVYQNSDVNLEQSYQNLSELLDKFIKLQQLNRQFRKVGLHARDLKDRGHVDAGIAACRLLENLGKVAETYFRDNKADAYQQFKSRCDYYIDAAKPVLEAHRGWKRILGNLLLAILGVGIGYAVAICVNKAINGHFFFFNKTRSIEKLNQLSEEFPKMEVPAIK